MKKVLFVLIGVMFSFSVLPSSASAACGDSISTGAGTSGDPYQITSPTELAAVSNCLGAGNSGKYFKLINNIDLNVSPYNTGSGWTPLGTSGSYFYGKFDGNNKTISNLFINSTVSVRGMFGYTQSSTIENLVLENVNITSTQNYVGGLVGYSNTSSIINNVSVSGSVVSSSSRVGGLVGYANLTNISNSSSSATVSGTSDVGGLVGYTQGTNDSNATVTNSYATGNVRGSSSVGGLIGFKYYGIASQSYATGNILGDKDGGLTNTASGGFVGTPCLGIITESYATGDVYGDSDLGGFGGQSHNCGGTISNSYTRGNIYPSGPGTGGSFMRYIYLGTVTNSYATGSVEGQTNGGFIFWDHTCSNCINNFWDTQTSGQSTGGVLSGGRATGKTTAQMKDQSTYSAWDFSAIWNIDGAINGGYPYLRWQPVDVTAPVVSFLSPLNNATSVPTNANLVITFDEAVNVEVGNISIFKSNDDSLVEEIDVTSGQVTGTGTNTITINPSSELEEQTSYYVQVDATAFDDLFSNSFLGIVDTVSWSFTTADETNPIVTFLSPDNGATDVLLSSDLVAVFSEVVSVSVGNISIFKSNDDSLVEEIDVTSGQVTGTGTNTITISPASDFEYGTAYYVQIDTTAFSDVGGNSYSGILNTSSWSFATLSAPVVPVSRISSSGSSSLAIANFFTQQNKINPAPNAVNQKPMAPNPVIKSEVSIVKILKPRFSGEEVRVLQKFLNNNGFFVALIGAGSVGNETNYFGPKTKEALILFQKSNPPLAPDGILGPKTLAVMKELSNNSF